MDSFGWSTETGLASVTVNKVEFSPHDNSAARLLALVNCESTVFETKVISILREEHWENSFLEPVARSGLGISIHEHVSAS